MREREPVGRLVSAMQPAPDCYSRPTAVRASFLSKTSYSDRHLHQHHGREALYRSNSSLELMQEHEPAPRSPLLRREYGSHGSIDVISAAPTLQPSDSFFEMLQDMKPSLGADQRSPGPQQYLSGRHSDHDERASPKTGRRKLGRLWGGKTGAVRSETDSGGGEEPQRRRAFAHYDCQSVTANLSYAAKVRSLLLSRRRNTTTGASAASMARHQQGRASTPDPSSPGTAEEDPGDGHSNDLIHSCPYFRNEIGGEAERVVWLTRQQNGSRGGALHRPLLACGMSVLEFSSNDTHWRASVCPYSLGARPVEAVDHGAHYYRHYFFGKDHQNWFGMDENLGPVAISLRRELVEKGPVGEDSGPIYRYRLVIRTSELLTLRGSVLEDAIPNIKTANSSKAFNTKEVLEYVAPEVQLSCLRLGVIGPQTEEALLKLDEQGISTHYKVGVLYCRAGQASEEQMYNNQDAGPAFSEFLDTIGTRVRLKGFDKYRAGLDNKTDSTGLYSVYAQHQDCEIMFHVSTLLPFTPNNRQQLLRKRHIGNDIVTIVFQEPGALPFTPKVIRSQFQHVFIVVRAVNPCTDNAHYSVAVSRSKEVPVFGPPIPQGGMFPKSKAFTDFLLAKVINAENAAHRSDKFSTMATRTRQEYLKELVNNYTTSTVVETTQKFSIISFSSKKKDRWRPRILPDGVQRGALCWQVLLDDSSQATLVDCFLAISSDSLVLIEEASREIVFSAPCRSVLGWSTNTNSLRLYYHQGECVTFHMREGGERDELMEVVVRLRTVTQGSVAQELSLKRNPLGQLGFHVQPDGVVTQVEHKGLAWVAGLRQGARLVEICKVAVSTLSHDQMIDLLKTSVAVTVTIVPPNSDGTVRKGCSEQVCVYSSGFEGDYENVNNQDTRINKTARQQPINKRYERSFSPPRSSNSSGYGTGSSSKSFTGDRFNNLDVNNYSVLDNNQHDFKVGEVVSACLMKAERSHQVRRQVERTPHDHLPQSDFGSGKTLAPEVSRDKTVSLETGASRLVGLSDGHSTDTSSASERLLGFPSEDDLSGGSSPGGLRRSKTTGCIANLRGDSPRSQGSRESPRSQGSRESPRAREAKLRPRQQQQRNSATLSTLQQDLIRLINPDADTPPPKESRAKISESLPDVRRDKGSQEEVIVTVARPATVIAAGKTSREDSRQLRVSKTSSGKQRTLLLPDAQGMDWPSLVDTATRAMVDSDHHAPLDHSSSLEDELRNKITHLETELSREAMARLSLEEEVRSLQEENRRLHQESQSAAQQLRRFTEWFYQTMDKQ